MTVKKYLSEYPELVKEWHPTKNGNFTPEDFTHASNKRAWWLCPNNHSYDSIIANRTTNKSGCPYCAGQKASEENNLQALFPEIAKEWHPTKNNELTPKQVTYGSKKKVWWLCPKGHSYEATMNHRTSAQKSGCPYCSNQSSEPEIRILSELKWFFEEVNSRYRVDGVEIDIFLPNINLAIEYDGSYWHKDKEDSDIKKNMFLLSRDIDLIRVREQPLNPLSENDVIVSNRSLEKKELDKIFKKIYTFADNNTKEKITSYFARPSFVNDELFKEYRSYFPSPFPENSLIETHPKLSEEWDYEKNFPLRPENFSSGGHNKVWWLCPKGHSYSSYVYSRTDKNQKRGCPFCTGQKVSKDNNLLIMFPEVAKEWHPTKNKELTPKEFTSGSKKKVWWLCPKGHSYNSVINSRTTRKSPTGCPYCAGKKVSMDNNLLVLFPEIAKEWHPIKNKELTPKQVTAGSNKKVWWLCPKGHSYEAQINHRARKSGRGCFYCSGRNSLNYDLFK